MKIVNIIGGLGNQMFQYAFAIVIKNTLPTEDVRYYIGAFRGYKLHNGFELADIFNLKLLRASHWDVMRYYWPIFHYKLWQIARHVLPSRKAIKEIADCPISLENIKAINFFEGYFQQRRYFEHYRKEILDTYTFPSFKDKKNLEVVQFISEKESASIHVRRGDYMNNSLYSGICTLAYYKEAIKELNVRTNTERVVIFSNDIEWCKKSLREELSKYEVIFVDWNIGKNSYKDMQLMSMCNHNIIANSSFSWWGAWLNTNTDKVVISPKKWDNSNNDSTALLDSKWILI